MQTFLPYADFQETARCLDYRRLGKQRLEAKQIISLLEKYDTGIDISKLPWGNHPAVRMWIKSTTVLKVYYNTIVNEWVKRGYNNNMELYELDCPEIGDVVGYSYPKWFDRRDFHDAHKSKLLQKDYNYYKQYNWDIPLDLEYQWG